MSEQNDRLFYVFLLGAAAFALIIWIAVAFERNQPKPSTPHPLPPLITKAPDRVEPPAPAPAPVPSNPPAEVSQPDPAPALTTDDGTSLDLQPSIDAAPAPEANDAQASDPHFDQLPVVAPAATEQPAVIEPAPIHRASRNRFRRHRQHGQWHLRHHWTGHHHGKPGPTSCEPLCEFFKGTARGAGLIP